jgi:cytochrome c peroxidase
MRKLKYLCSIGIFLIALSLCFYSCRPEKIYIISTRTNASLEAVALGKKLFFDKRLSINNSISCASCHQVAFAFTDRKKLSQGVYGRSAFRNAPSLLNVSYAPTLMYDGQVPTLEMQAIVPLKDHREMGNDLPKLIKKLARIPFYANAAKEVYHRSFDAWVLTRSLSAFERSLFSTKSKYDRYMAGDKDALSTSAKRGLKLFSKDFACVACHPAPLFTTFETANNGLYKIYGKDKGRYRVTSNKKDIGKFKIPSLRNVELTFPYMHDGSLQTLETVLSHYSQGGKKGENQDKKIHAFRLTNQNKTDLISFLCSLTDTSYSVNFNQKKDFILPSFH